MSSRRKVLSTRELIERVKTLQAEQRRSGRQFARARRIAKKPKEKWKGTFHSLRRRCLFCGHIINDSRRFTWKHKKQTFDVQMGGRLPGGRGFIKYTEVEDPEYDKIMLAQLRRVAQTYGYSLVKRK